MLRRVISAIVIATAAVLAPAGAAHADQADTDYTVQALDADGQPLSETYTITAVEAGTGVTAGAAGGDGGGVSLASTGPTSLPYLAIAGGLLLAGVAAIVVSRIRATRQH